MPAESAKDALAVVSDCDILFTERLLALHNCGIKSLNSTLKTLPLPYETLRVRGASVYETLRERRECVRQKSSH
ncbi:MAG: hypothetical protein ACSI46_12140 [Gloeotrichia echinulata DVL01]